ncbi:MAG: helix-turn-helix domain-containing protein [Sulfobacillus sp.]
MDPSRCRIGLSIRARREEQHLSAEEVARDTGWSSTYLRYVEDGVRTPPGSAEAEKVAKVVDLPPTTVGGRLAMEELFWAWTAPKERRGISTAVHAAQALSDDELLEILDRNNRPLVRRGWQPTPVEMNRDPRGTMAAWPRPALVDLLCTVSVRMTLDDGGIAIEMPTGSSIRELFSELSHSEQAELQSELTDDLTTPPHDPT